MGPVVEIYKVNKKLLGILCFFKVSHIKKRLLRS